MSKLEYMNFEEILMDKNVQIAGIVVGSVFVAGNLLEFMFDRYRRKNYYSLHALVTNFSIALLQQLTDVFNKLLFFFGFIFVQQNYSLVHLLHLGEIKVDFPFSISSHFPFIEINFGMILIWSFILLLADFCQYWLHRLSHEVNIMWAGHIVHHSMEEYNYAVALRQSFIENLYTWIFFLPLAFFGIPWQLFIMAYSISLIWQFFVHTQYIYKLGWLEKIFATPSHHRVHHGKNEQYIDKNYGAFLIIWDKLFGTFEPEMEAVDYGIKVPLQTHNPVWANVHHHVHIFKMSLKTNGIQNKLTVILGRPAFVPNDLQNEYHALKLLQKPNKQLLSTIKSFYIFFNFLLTALSAFLLVNYYDTGKESFIFLAMLIACSFAVNISLLENKKWADYAEVSKLAIVLVIGILCLNGGQNIPGLLAAGLAIAMLACTGWIARDYRKNVPNVKATPT